MDNNTNPLTRITKNIRTPIQPPNTPQPPIDPHQNPPEPAKHWSDDALCKGKTDQMFPKEHKDLSYISEARRMCRQCPVRKDCLEYALSFPASDQHGVWAGLTPRQLDSEAKRRGVRVERFTLAQVWSHLNRG